MQVGQYFNPNIFGLSALSPADRDSMSGLIESGNLFRYSTPNSLNDQFERTLADFLGVHGALTVTNGSAGLQAALIGASIAPGAKVGVSALTFVATANAVCSVGASPIPIDLDEKLGMDLEDLTSKLDSLDALIPVYIPGHASNLNEIITLSRARDIPAIEDACQAFGVRVKGAFAGTIGDFGVFSFQQNKQISAGEGGAVLARDPEKLRFLRRYADHGAVRAENGIPSWESDRALLGQNLRMTEMQALLLDAQMRSVSSQLANQRRARDFILPLLSSWPVTLVESHDPEGDSCAYAAMLFRSSVEAQQWIKKASEQHILLKHFWAAPFFKLSSIKQYLRARALPVSAPRALEWAERLVALPLPPTLTDQLLESFAQAIEALPRRIEKKS